MTHSTALSWSSLPLRERGRAEKQIDWISHWQKWASFGPAVLFESAGEITPASRWIILAGDPEMEFYEVNGNPLFSGADGPAPASITIWEFLNSIAGTETGNELLKGPKEPIKKYSEDLGGQDFVPFPFCLSKAWFGVFSYEFGQKHIIKNIEKNKLGSALVPDYYFFKPRSVMAFDRLTCEWFCFGKETLSNVKMQDLKREGFKAHSFEAKASPEVYSRMVDLAKDYISHGDIYQANLAQVFQAKWEGSEGTLFQLLREMNPGPFMGLFKGREFTVVSSSPERLVAGQGDWLETRPIAGTRPRGVDPVQDLRNQWDLKTSPKEQAEHLMLVDLARNDLGKVSRFGTVEVKNFAQIESYARVHHLVSIIRSQLSPSKKFSEVVQSLFPGGTITGCPKVRSMEIIRELEPQTRGYYTGSMGYLAQGPCFDFNILIRTFTLFPSGKLEFLAGAGIVADSDPQKEYMETLYKVEALAQALGSSLFSKP